MSNEKDFTVVTIEEGYLLLETKEARDFINQLVENGTLWETLSNILNSYVSSQLINDRSKEIDDLKLILGSVVKKLDTMDNKLTALPPSSDNSGKLNYNKSDIVEPSEVKIKVEKKSTKHTGGLGSILNNFNNLKKGD